MIIEVTRLIDRWLNHPDYGVDAMLQLVGRQTPEGDSDELPQTPSIFNDTEHEMGLLMEPDKSPALIVFCARGPKVDIRNAMIQKGSQAVAYISYVTRDVPEIQAARDGNYTLRAVKMSLTRFNQWGKAEQYRSLNGITVAALGPLDEYQTRSAVGRSRMWGFVQVGALVLDSQP